MRCNFLGLILTTLMMATVACHPVDKDGTFTVSGRIESGAGEAEFLDELRGRAGAECAAAGADAEDGDARRRARTAAVAGARGRDCDHLRKHAERGSRQGAGQVSSGAGDRARSEGKRL